MNGYGANLILRCRILDTIQLVHVSDRAACQATAGTFSQPAYFNTPYCGALGSQILQDMSCQQYSTGTSKLHHDLDAIQGCCQCPSGCGRCLRSISRVARGWGQAPHCWNQRLRIRTSVQLLPSIARFFQVKG